MNPSPDQTAINTIRTLAMDSVQQAKSGHPGTAMAMAPVVTARVAVEQASTFGWDRYVGSRGVVIGMRTFGASAPLGELQKKFGFAPEHIVSVAKAQIAQNHSKGRNRRDS